jgi:hypothetical protein
VLNDLEPVTIKSCDALDKATAALKRAKGE